MHWWHFKWIYQSFVNIAKQYTRSMSKFFPNALERNPAFFAWSIVKFLITMKWKEGIAMVGSWESGWIMSPVWENMETWLPSPSRSSDPSFCLCGIDMWSEFTLLGLYFLILPNCFVSLAAPLGRSLPIVVLQLCFTSLCHQNLNDVAMGKKY